MFIVLHRMRESRLISRVTALSMYGTLPGDQQGATLLLLHLARVRRSTISLYTWYMRLIAPVGICTH